MCCRGSSCTHAYAYDGPIELSSSADTSWELMQIKTSKERPHGEWRIEVTNQLAYTNEWVRTPCIRSSEKVKHPIVQVYLDVIQDWG